MRHRGRCTGICNGLIKQQRFGGYSGGVSDKERKLGLVTKNEIELYRDTSVPHNSTYLLYTQEEVQGVSYLFRTRRELIENSLRFKLWTVYVLRRGEEKYMFADIAFAFVLGTITAILYNFTNSKEGPGEGDRERTGSGMENGQVSLKTCKVCTIAFSEGNVLNVLPCKHEMHVNCTREYFGSNDNCVECGYVLDWLEEVVVIEGRGWVVADMLEQRVFGNRESDFEAQQVSVARVAESTRETNERTETASCPICLGEYSAGESLVRLPCFHEFHTDCSNMWFSQHRDCVICREEVNVRESAPGLLDLLRRSGFGEGLSELERDLLPSRIYGHDEPSTPRNEPENVDSGSQTSPSTDSPDREAASQEEAEADNGTQRESEAPTCSICRCEYEDGDELLRLPCLHENHKECALPWMLRESRCPVCRHDVNVIGFEYQSGSPLTREQADHLPTRSYRASVHLQPARVVNVEPVHNHRTAMNLRTAREAGGGANRQNVIQVVERGDEGRASVWKCAICKLPFQSGQELKRMPCLDELHSTCIQGWIRTRRDCPMCSADIVHSVSTLGEDSNLTIEEAINVLPTRLADENVSTTEARSGSEDSVIIISDDNSDVVVVAPSENTDSSPRRGSIFRRLRQLIRRSVSPSH